MSQSRHSRSISSSFKFNSPLFSSSETVNKHSSASGTEVHQSDSDHSLVTCINKKKTIKQSDSSPSSYLSHKPIPHQALVYSLPVVTGPKVPASGEAIPKQLKSFKIIKEKRRISRLFTFENKQNKDNCSNAEYNLNGNTEKTNTISIPITSAGKEIKRFHDLLPLKLPTLAKLTANSIDSPCNDSFHRTLSASQSISDSSFPRPLLENSPRPLSDDYSHNPPLSLVLPLSNSFSPAVHSSLTSRVSTDDFTPAALPHFSKDFVNDEIYPEASDSPWLDSDNEQFDERLGVELQYQQHTCNIGQEIRMECLKSFSRGADEEINKLSLTPLSTDSRSEESFRPFSSASVSLSTRSLQSNEDSPMGHSYSPILDQVLQNQNIQQRPPFNSSRVKPPLLRQQAVNNNSNADQEIISN
jgi:hypothetical protein